MSVTKKAVRKYTARKTKKKAAKKATLVLTPRKNKNTKHKKSAVVVKISKTDMTNIILGSRGALFTSTHVDTSGKPRTMDAIVTSDDPQNDLGFITVFSVKDKGYRTINPQTLTDLSIDNIHYQTK